MPYFITMESKSSRPLLTNPACVHALNAPMKAISSGLTPELSIWEKSANASDPRPWTARPFYHTSPSQQILVLHCLKYVHCKLHLATFGIHINQSSAQKHSDHSAV